jgi:hypothetical protein
MSSQRFLICSFPMHHVCGQTFGVRGRHKRKKEEGERLEGRGEGAYTTLSRTSRT